MKFTKEQAVEQLKGLLTEGGKTLHLSDRTINENIDDLIPLLVNDETELSDFISKASLIYPHYDFSKVDYIKSNVKVCVICPEHGLFFQTPNNLLNGHGCPQCSKSKRILDRNTLIYGVARNDYKGRCVDDNGNLLKSYDIWYGMIRRCYDSKSLEYKTTYQDCTVCDEWLYILLYRKHQ
jgi:glutaredoxin